jgi:hypothetical protein
MYLLSKQGLVKTKEGFKSPKSEEPISKKPAKKMSAVEK